MWILGEAAPYVDVESGLALHISGFPKDKKKYNKSSKGNEVLQPKPSPNTKPSVRRFNRRSWQKRKTSNKEVEVDVEGNESEEDNESEKDKIMCEDAEECFDSSSYDDSSSSEEEKVLKPKKFSKKKRQVKDESSSSEDEKPLKNKKRSKHVKDVKKKKKKPLTAEQIKKIEYFDDLPGLRSRTVPSLLFAAIRDSQVYTESFMSDIGFSSSQNTFDDPFVKEWFKQFDPKPLKEIRACDIDEKLVLTKTVDFMFKVNFLMLFANMMVFADTMKAFVNLDYQTEGFYDVCDNVSQTRTSSVPPTDKKSFCSMIEEKISMISAEKIALEDLLKRANVEFPNDEEVIELYEKYR
ncbi:hypothetical protein Tco_1282313 [Tanacetum coccineum]